MKKTEDKEFTLVPQSGCRFPDRDALKRSATEGLTVRDERLIAAAEGDGEGDADIFAGLKLRPDGNVVFPDRDSLRRRHVSPRPLWGGLAAAAVAALAAVYLLIPSTPSGDGRELVSRAVSPRTQTDTAFLTPAAGDAVASEIALAVSGGAAAVPRKKVKAAVTEATDSARQEEPAGEHYERFAPIGAGELLAAALPEVKLASRDVAALSDAGRKGASGRTVNIWGNPVELPSLKRSEAALALTRLYVSGRGRIGGVDGLIYSRSTTVERYDLNGNLLSRTVQRGKDKN